MSGRLGSLRVLRPVEGAPTGTPSRASHLQWAPARADAVIDLTSVPQRAPGRSRQDDEIAAARARLLEGILAGDLSISEACRQAGISRARFYQLRALYREQGVAGLRPRPRERLMLRLPKKVEGAIVAYALLQPAHGEKLIARELARPELGGIKVSRHGVGEVLRRNGLSRKEARAARANLGQAEPAATRTESVVETDWFSSIYEKYRRYVYHVCLQKLGDPAVAEDATQETFVRVYTNISRYDAQRSILPWLKTIASNLCTDMHRRNSRAPESVTDPADDIWSGQTADEEPFDAVTAREQRAKLESALKQLPARQRRALLLHALEGWDYSAIASAEDVSQQAIKSLLFRARETLRKSRESGLLGVAIIGWRKARARVQDATHRCAGRIDAASPCFMASAQAVQNGTLALIMALGIGFSSSPGWAPTQTALASRDRLGGSIAPPLAFRAEITPRPPALDVLRDTTSSLAGDVIDPTRGATPEKTQFQSIVPSPSYERDHTVFAAGAVDCVRPPCAVLFVTHDGGGTWTKSRADRLSGTTIMLPPAYPQDDRIFAMGPSGLQVSSDGGRSFTVATPLSGGAAMSPAFNTGEEGRRILIGGMGTIMEYWPDKEGLTKPAPLVVAPRQFSNVAFAPDYPRHEIIFAGSRSANSGNVYGSVVDRCVGSLCESIPLPTLGDPAFALSPSFGTDGVVYAYTGMSLFRSDDVGAHFEPVRLPSQFPGNTLRSVVVKPRTTSGLFIAYFTQDARDTGLYHSGNGGRTWTALRVGLAGFESGVRDIAATITGRLFAAGIAGGLACSEDGGKYWSVRCPVLAP